jgi:glutamate-1-semialdehyde 2,1-aminomutase
LATIEALHQPGQYEQLETLSARLEQGWRAAAEQAGVSAYFTRVGSMMGMFFQKGPVTDYASAAGSDTKLYARFFHAMLNRGVYLAPSQFEAVFVSLAHTPELIDETITAAASAFEEATG